MAFQFLIGKMFLILLGIFGVKEKRAIFASLLNKALQCRFKEKGA